MHPDEVTTEEGPLETTRPCPTRTVDRIFFGQRMSRTIPYKSRYRLETPQDYRYVRWVFPRDNTKAPEYPTPSRGLTAVCSVGHPYSVNIFLIEVRIICKTTVTFIRDFSDDSVVLFCIRYSSDERFLYSSDFTDGVSLVYTLTSGGPRCPSTGSV